MVRTNPDVNVESWSTDRLANYINDTAPTAAALGDDDPGAAQITANVEAAIDELRSRRDVATDGGTVDEPTIEDVTDDEWLTHVTDDTTTFSLRHERSTRTVVEDGEAVHKIVESAADDANPASVSWSRPYFTRCPACGDDVEKTREGDEDDDQYVETWSCEACAWSHRRASTASPHRTDDVDAKPIWSTTTFPHDAIDKPDDTVDFDKLVDGFDDEDDPKGKAANLMRDLTLSVKAKATGTFEDAAYVSAEYDDDSNKTAEAYIDTVECARCGDVVEAPAATKHAHFGEVCPACEDATVWSVDDADLPEDVVDRMGDHKTFSRSNIVSYLKDVAFFGAYVAEVSDDEDAGGFDGIKTGKGGKIGVQAGTGRKGTGLRRPKGAAHNQAHFRTVLRDLVDTGLVDKSPADADVDDPNAHYTITDKGRDVLSELARCETCGESHDVFVRRSTYKAGRRTEKSSTLTTGCKACGDAEGYTPGAMVIESSSQSNYTRIASVDDA